MNKALILVILALFGLNAMASQMFRPITSRPGSPPPFNPTTSRPVLYDDAEDNNLALNLNLPRDPNSYRIRFDEQAQDDEMFRMELPRGSTPPFNPTPKFRLDDSEDNEMFRMELPRGSTPPFNPTPSGGWTSTGPYINRPTKGGLNFDDAEDNEMYRMEIPRGSTGPYNPTPSGGWSSTGPYINRPTNGGFNFDDAEDNEMYRMEIPRGSTGPYNPNPRFNGFDDAEDNEMFRMELPRGSTPPFNPNPRVRFDDAADDEMFRMELPRGSTPPFNPNPRVRFDDAADDEMFTQGDMGRMGGFLGSGRSGVIGGGGSAPGGVAWGGAGQYAHQIGKNTHLIGGASVSHAPGSRVNIQPHVGMKFSF